MKPCPFRHVDADGHILCDKIKFGDREVSLNICRVCPISAINCAHLRATLDHRARAPITVRYGTGRTEVWDDVAPSIALERAACSVKVIPITSPRDCAGCSLRQPMPLIETIPVKPQMITRNAMTIANAARIEKSAPARRPAAAAMQTAPNVDDEPRKNLVAAKIIQLQEWLTKQKSPPLENNSVEERTMSIAAGAERIAILKTLSVNGMLRGEEKRAGWTD